MKQSPEDIERDIEHTRQELARTLEALQTKLSIRRKVNAAMETARESGGAVAAVVTDTVKRYPMQVAMVAAPLVWMLASRAFSNRRQNRRH